MQTLLTHILLISGSSLLRDVHVGIPSSGGQWFGVDIFFLSFILLLPNIFSWKSWCFVQFLEVMSLWFRVLMNTIIIFKMVLMIRYVSFQVYSQCTCQRKRVYSQCFKKLKAVLRCSFFPSQLRCMPSGGMSISLYLNK